VKGRKRHILVDTLGLILAVVVTAASVQDREGALSLLVSLRHGFSRLRLIWADQAYAGDLIDWLWDLRPWRKVRLEIVKRPEGIKGFLLLPKRSFSRHEIEAVPIPSQTGRAGTGMGHAPG
jgi:putative transposase